MPAAGAGGAGGAAVALAVHLVRLVLRWCCVGAALVLRWCGRCVWWGNALLLGIYSDLAAVLIMFLLFLIYCP